jgi:hypothetical protein
MKKLSLFLLLFASLSSSLIGQKVWATDRINIYIVNNTSQTVSFQVVYIASSPISDACIGSSTSPPYDDNSSCNGVTITLGSGQSSGNACNFTIDDPLACDFVTQLGYFSINGGGETSNNGWQVNDAMFGPLSATYPSGSSFKHSGSSLYSLTFNYNE